MEGEELLVFPNTKLFLLSNQTKELCDEVQLSVVTSVQNGSELVILLLGRETLALDLAVPAVKLCDGSYLLPTDSSCFGIELSRFRRRMVPIIAFQQRCNSDISPADAECFEIILRSFSSFREAPVPKHFSDIPDVCLARSLNVSLTNP